MSGPAPAPARRSRGNRRLSRQSVPPLIQPLEQRRLFSVTVTEAYPGYYEIHGDDNDNYIDVAVCMTENTFTIDGNTYADVSYILAYGYGGNDTIQLISFDGAGIIAGGIVAGAGNDTITMNFDGGIWAGSGEDTVYLSESFRGQAYGDGGNDQIYISGLCLNADVRGGTGDDYIDCTANAYSVVIHGDQGNDTLYGSDYDDELYGDEGHDHVNGGYGDDAFYYADGDDIDGGDGYDILYMSSPNSQTNVEEVL
jgi:hypothetical protein